MVHVLIHRTHTRARGECLALSVTRCVLLQLLDVPVLLPQDGNLVPEQHRVQSHLGVHQRHEPKPAAEDVHAGLPLGEMVRVGPPRHLGALGLQKQTREESICVISPTTTLSCPERFVTLLQHVIC